MALARSSHPALVAACLFLTPGCREPGGGPCVHTYRDPVLAITAATDDATGAPIASVFIADVTVRGEARPVTYLLSTGFGARARGDTIVCGVPCGFGTTEGPYAFTANASGYGQRQIVVDARFARFDGGCPSFNEGSTDVAVSLPRAS